MRTPATKRPRPCLAATGSTARSALLRRPSGRKSRPQHDLREAEGCVPARVDPPRRPPAGAWARQTCASSRRGLLPGPHGFGEAGQGGRRDPPRNARDRRGPRRWFLPWGRQSPVPRMRGDPRLPRPVSFLMPSIFPANSGTSRARTCGTTSAPLASATTISRGFTRAWPTSTVMLTASTHTRSLPVCTNRPRVNRG
jgi:hypothetical protein